MSTITWAADASGDFTNKNNWSPAKVPGSTDFAHITAVGLFDFTVSSAVNETVESLHTSANAGLSITANQFTDTDGTGGVRIGVDPGVSYGEVLVGPDATFYVGGAFVNDGYIGLTSTLTTQSSSLVIAPGGMVLLGTGQLSLKAGGLIIGAVSTATLTNDSTIIGAGFVGEGPTYIDNTHYGVIDGVGGMSLDTTNPLTNQGLIEATGTGAGLTLTGVVNNVGGTIAANGAYLDLYTSEISGGLLTSSANGIIADTNNHSYLGGVTSPLTMAANFELTGTLGIRGSIINTGQFFVPAYSIGDLLLGGNLTLSGGGSIELGESAGNQIQFTNHFIFDNADNTIAGAGTIGGYGFTLLNGGVIDGSANYYPLFVNTAGYAATNTGLMEGTGGGGLLLLIPTVTNTGGTILAGNGSVVSLEGAEIDGGVVSIAAGGALNASAMGCVINDLSGGTLINAGAVEATGGATLTVEGGTVTNTGVLAAGGGSAIELQQVTVYGGGLATTVGGTIALNDGVVVEAAGSFTNGGAIQIHSASKLTDLRILNAGVTLSGGGTVSLIGTKARIVGYAAAATLTNVDNTLTGTGFIGANQLTFTNAAAGVVDAMGAFGLTVGTKGETLVNAGLMEATGGGTLAIVNTTVANAGGTIMATNVSPVKLQDAVVQGGGITATGSGVIKFNVAGGELDGTASAVSLSGVAFIVNGSNETLVGSIANAGKINLIASTSTSDLIIGAAGATLSGGGQVNMTNSLSNRIYGLAPADTLTNVDNRIDGAGVLGNGVMTLVNAAKGQIVGNQNFALTIDTGMNTIVNAGLIENVGKGGTLVKSAVANTGTIEAATAGTLTFTQTVAGTGIAVINGGTLYVQKAFAEKVNFTGTTGVLELGASQQFTGAVSGLSKTGTSWLDLVDIGFFAAKTKATYSGTTASGTLTVTDGTHTAHIALQGNYTGSTWTVSSDGHGGTKVVDPSTGAGPLAQAMAGMPRGAQGGHDMRFSDPLPRPFLLIARA